jgi:hypothetical protein
MNLWRLAELCNENLDKLSSGLICDLQNRAATWPIRYETETPVLQVIEADLLLSIELFS